MPATIRTAGPVLLLGVALLVLAACGQAVSTPEVGGYTTARPTDTLGPAARPEPPASTPPPSAVLPLTPPRVRPSDTPAQPTVTPRAARTPTSAPDVTPSDTPVRPTVTAFATWTPTITPTSGPSTTPYLIAHARLSDVEVEDMIWRVNGFSVEGTLRRQDVDVNGDGVTELLVAGEGANVESFIAVFGRSGGAWRESFFERSAMWGKYCSWSQAAVRDGIVVADFLMCNGGTGVVYMDWQQRWILCQAGDCRKIWSGPMAYTWYGYGPSGAVTRDFDVSELHREGDTVIRLTRRSWGMYALTGDAAIFSCDPPSTLPSHSWLGPDTVDTYRWDGQAYALVEREPLSTGQSFSSRTDAMTKETRRLVGEVIERAAERPSGGISGDDVRALKQGLWGATSSSEEAVALYAAAHSGPPDVLGPYVAGMVTSDKPLRCLVSALHYADGSFNLIGRAEIMCTADFSRARFVDLTGDGTPELVVTTLPPDTDNAETAAGTERAYVFAVNGDGLVELARIEGAINGPDGMGIRLVEPASGGRDQILAGLPLISTTERSFLPDMLARNFQIYEWDATARQFVPRGTWTAPDLGPLRP